MDRKKGDHVYIVVRRGTMGGDKLCCGSFVDELVIIDEYTATSARVRAALVIHGVTLYLTRQEAQLIIEAEAACSHC
jgi:hypothetical protein